MGLYSVYAKLPRENSTESKFAVWCRWMIFLYLLYPCFQKCLEKFGKRAILVLTLVLGGVFLMDCLCYIVL